MSSEHVPTTVSHSAAPSVAADRVLLLACRDPLCQAAALTCRSWHAAFNKLLRESWSALRTSLLNRRSAAASHAQHDDLSSQLRDEIERIARSFGTCAQDSTILERRCELGGLEVEPGTVPPFEFDEAVRLLRAGAGTGSVQAHAAYTGVHGLLHFDPDPGPLNTAVLFVGVAASLEVLGRTGAHAHELASRSKRACELFELLAVAPGTALRDDVFSTCIKYYHEYEECFGNITAMCRACFRSGSLYDVGRDASMLWRHEFPIPGGWLQLQLRTPVALHFAWAVFEMQSLIDSASFRLPRVGVHIRHPGATLPAALLSDARLDLFLTGRPVFASPAIEDPRALNKRRPDCNGGRSASVCQMLQQAARLLSWCGLLSVESASEALRQWASIMQPDTGLQRRVELVKTRMGSLHISQLLRVLAGSSQVVLDTPGGLPPLEVGMPRAWATALDALLPPDASLSSALTRILVDDMVSTDDTVRGGGRRKDTCGRRWSELLATPKLLRHRWLRAMPHLAFELLRRRDARRLRQLVGLEPKLLRALRRRGPEAPPFYSGEDNNNVSELLIAPGGCEDLLVAACWRRGLTHQIVAAFLESGAFVACTSEDQPKSEVLDARLACVEAARKVRNLKTLAVLQDAWGALTQA